MNLVIFGPPGAGKGTQSNLIKKKYKLYQLSTGELLRKEIKNKTDLGQKISSIMNLGNLVSDEVVGNLIENYISNDNFKSRLIFDGYPRNLIQAKNLDNLMKKYDQKLDIVLKLSVSLETIVTTNAQITGSLEMTGAVTSSFALIKTQSPSGDVLTVNVGGQDKVTINNDGTLVVKEVATLPTGEKGALSVSGSNFFVYL